MAWGRGLAILSDRRISISDYQSYLILRDPPEQAPVEIRKSFREHRDPASGQNNGREQRQLAAAMNDWKSEGALLAHYRLQNPFPQSWSDPIEEAQAKQRLQYRKSTSRYSVLQEESVSSSLKGLVGGDLFSGGAVKEDEPDPLGTADSVVRVLRQRGIHADDNVRLREHAPLKLVCRY